MVKVAKLFVLIALALAFSGCAGDIAFKKGEKMSVEGDLDRAVGYYRQALQEDPENISYKTRLTAAQRDATQMHVVRASQYLDAKNADVAIYESQQALLLSPDNGRAVQLLKGAGKLKELQGHLAAGRNFYYAGRPNEAVDEFTKALEFDAEQPEAKSFIEKITKQKAALGGSDEGLTLASDQPITLSFKDAKLKEVFEFLSKLSGVSILFDDDVKDQPVTVFAKDISFKQALGLLLATNKLFMKKIAQDAIIIIPKTKSKQDQYQDLLIKTFYLSNIPAKDMVNIIRTMLETRKVIINEQLNSITLRETPDKLKLAEKLIEVNDRKDSEVVIDVEVMSVDRGDNLRYGLNLPKSVTGTYVPPAGGVPSVAPTDFTANTVTNISNFNSGINNGWQTIKDNIWFAYPSVTADWSKSRSHAETLTNPSIRVLNNKPAKILIGRRIPVQTGQSLIQGATTTAFEYRDVGIKLTVEPDIGLNNDVKLKATLEVSSLGDNIIVGDTSQPSFNTTTAESVLNLRDGETVVIGGLLENIKNNNISGIAGVIDVPILGKIFSTNTVGPNSKRELIMTLTPHIVRPQVIPSAEYSAFYSGTEEAFDTKPLFEEKKEKLSVPEEDEQAVSAEPGKATEVQPQPGQPVQPKKPPLSEGQPQAIPSRKIGRVGVIGFAPEVVPIEVGQELTVDVMATDLDSVFEAPLSIIYNPKLVEFVKAEEGEFMKVDGKPTSFTAASNDKIGFIDVFLTRLGKVQGVSGSGKLFSLTFKGKAPGISPLVFKQNMLKDANKQPVSADLKTGTLYVK